MKRSLLLASALFFSGTIAAQAAPKNIILFIGDGMGEAEIALARAYEFDGNEGMFVDTMKDRGSVIVKQLMVADPSKLEFAGSSGSGGTTISTGYRTSEERIAVKAEDGSHYKTIMEEAKEQG
ncbi:MAG: alkaline phosphatase, partial [Emcibacteraceae bacterium]|nr:alkaline phosphatase [Emcibacteraceae bacterium]